jgi:hypothetical protein
MRLAAQSLVPDAVILLENGCLQYDLVSHQLTPSLIGLFEKHATPVVTHVNAPRPIVERLGEHLRIYYFGDASLPRAVALESWDQSLSAAAALAVRLGFVKIGLVGVDLDSHNFQPQRVAIEALRYIPGISRYDFGGGVVKRGWKRRPLLPLVRRLPSGAVCVSGKGSPEDQRLTGAILCRDARRLERAKRGITAITEEAAAIAGKCVHSRLSARELARLTTLQILAENVWSRDPMKRRAIESLETVYLTGFWQLSGQVHADQERAKRAAEKKGILVFQELTERFNRAS